MVLQAIREVLATPSQFSLMDLEGFPYSLYEEQLTNYTEMERWFTGAALSDQKDNTTDLYPMRINPIVAAVIKHAHMLFGDAKNDGRPLVQPKAKYKPTNPGEKELADEVNEALSTVWDENNASALLIESSIIDQIYGGTVFKASYAPWEWDEYGGTRSIPIRIERVNPKNFVGVPEAGNPYSLVEAWTLQEMANTEAKLWGYEGTDEYVWYVEHWTRQKIDILIDGQPATRDVGGERVELSGPNPFGTVLMVYIPHLRAGTFLGFNSYMHLVGMVKELNARWGDYGDAVNDDSHPIIADRNISGSIQLKKINSWLEVVELGGITGISSNEHDPDMFQVTQPRASEAMMKMLDGIFRQFQRDAAIPSVGWGEDEGSQRSGATLEIRFWPLTSYAQMQRDFWSPGLNVFDKILLRMMAIKKLADIGPDHLKLKIKQVWANFLPKDRETDVNEWAIRATNTIASVDHLIELAGDVDDIDEEKERILDWIKKVEDIKAQIQSKYQMQQQAAQAETQLEMQASQMNNQKEIATKNAEVAKENAKKAPPPSVNPQRGGAK